MPNNLYYWRTRHGVEVDFIIYGPSHFLAIEVKNAVCVHAHDLRGLQTFCADYPEATPLLLHRGQDRLKIAGIDCIPVTEFLRGLLPGVIIK
ncbi:MAG: hypothetical protein A3F13_07860 [Gammaproteobacteria bacterium RIFCSPHIGHO2_12_FULL_40_19]|nr:MAG: hypothetical protein A3F13_07860 [Gammaproteobacteria bacterium RIFCSPHIGHO2_12_FULL_40_19]